MSATPLLNITQVASNQNQKEVTINDAVIALENATQASVAVSLATGNAATLSATQYASGVAFICSGQTADAATLTVPLTQRLFIVFNASTTYSVVVGGSSGAAITIPASNMALILNDGTNCRALSAGGGGTGGSGVTSVVGLGGIISLTQLVTAGIMPINNASPTGTFDASGATTVKVPTVAGTTDSSTNAASTGFVQAAIATLSGAVAVKPPAAVVATSPLPANGYVSASNQLVGGAAGVLTIDGVSPTVGQIVLVTGEATSANNGLYTLTTVGTTSAAYVLTRHSSMLASSSFSGALIVVTGGTVNAGSLWFCTNAGAVTVGATAINFEEVQASLPHIATNTLLANTSSGSAAPVATSVSAVLDTLGSAVGMIVYRGSSGWAALPAGASGYVLQANGSGVAPAWAAGTGLAAIANGDVIANVSGGVSAPVGVPLSGVLDTLGSTEGDLIYRGASGWVVLGPGTSGQMLKSGGAGAPPSWATIAGSGLYAIANNELLANTSGALAVPVATTLSTLLDTLGATEGSIIYRGASGWAELAPGTAGQVLQTNGTGAVPTWASVSGSGLTTIANGSLLANVSGASAVPVATTISAVLDILGTTRGTLLYRGASGWTELAPGTSGQVLTTGGAGTDPSWTTTSGGGAARNSAVMQAQWVSGAVVTNGVIYLVFNAPYAGTINSLDYFTGTGSFTANVQIGGTSVGGLSAVAVSSSTPANAAATSAATFTAGQTISVTISAATSAPTNALLGLNVTWS